MNKATDITKTLLTFSESPPYVGKIMKGANRTIHVLAALEGALQIVNASLLSVAIAAGAAAPFSLGTSLFVGGPVLVAWGAVYVTQAAVAGFKLLTGIALTGATNKIFNDLQKNKEGVESPKTNAAIANCRKMQAVGLASMAATSGFGLIPFLGAKVVVVNFMLPIFTNIMSSTLGGLNYLRTNLSRK
ncbi:hypothetical protein N9Y92_02575 [Chlamydiales bacterium]|nr:hypothetical protein [Chlamydiales bacterium]